jgi:hypothetical protein
VLQECEVRPLKFIIYVSYDTTVSKLHGVKNKRGNIRKRKILYIEKWRMMLKN